ncbi:MAG: hypothetical protein COA78_07935 [Blastopirellula sp.]|nr:MAG: hypothetical protein COA78_07935 [Blastopirellula sp.]
MQTTSEIGNRIDSSVSETEDSKPALSLQFRLCEVLLIFVVFALYVSFQTPDSNEAHYLTKAKHYWNPQWCPTDHFLNSADAHAVFYWTIGWLTLYFPLPVVAWIGRIICWALLAISWQRLSYTLIKQKWMSVCTAILWLLGMHYGHMAGEWVVGGVEAKCFSYALIFWAIGDALQHRWNRAWILLGIASAFHVLVGGWAVITLFIAWLLVERSKSGFVKMLPGLVAGGLISLIGLVPGAMLSAGQPDNVVASANHIYVFQRLSHHLVFNSFDQNFQIRFGLLSAVWLIIAGWIFFRREERKTNLVNAFVLGTLLLTVIGVLIDQVLLYQLAQHQLAAKLLRFYWFRLSDMAIPLGMAFSLPWGLMLIAEKRGWKVLNLGRYLLGASAISIVLLIGSHFIDSSFNLGLGRTTDHPDWKPVCLWIKENTPADAIFLTPRYQKSFKWNAERGEVFSTKDIPQDARSITEWSDRWNAVNRALYYISVPYKDRVPFVYTADPLQLKHDQLKYALDQVIDKYDCQYLVIDHRITANAWMKPGSTYQKVYPTAQSGNDTYEVYQIHE